MSAEPPGPRDRLGYLDSLRLLGSLVIALFHFLQTRAPNPAIRAVLESGGSMGFVVLFFLISGFVVPIAVGSGMGWREFFVRRAFRLLPIYLASLALVGIAGATGLLRYWSFVTDASPMTWFLNLTLLWSLVGARPFLGVSWTLVLEIIWYAIFFVGISVWRGRAATWLNIAGAAALVALALLSIELERRIPLGRPAMIYASALGFQMWNHARGAVGRRAILGWIALFLCVTTLTNYVAFGHFAHVRVSLGPVLAAWIGAPLIFAAVLLSPSVRTQSWLNNGPIPAIGVMSYSLYLLHPIGIEIALQYAPPGWEAPVMVIATAVLTWLGYRCIEAPGAELGRRIARALGRRAARPAHA